MYSRHRVGVCVCFGLWVSSVFFFFFLWLGEKEGACLVFGGGTSCASGSIGVRGLLQKQKKLVLFLCALLQFKQNEMVNNVKVYCRFRPQNQKEKGHKGVVCAETLDEQTVQLIRGVGVDGGPTTPATGSSSGPFTFDRVFDTESSQEEVRERRR